MCKVRAAPLSRAIEECEDEDEDVDDDSSSDVGYASDDEVASSDDDAPLHLKMLLMLSDEDVDFDWPDLKAGEHTELSAASGMKWVIHAAAPNDTLSGISLLHRANPEYMLALSRELNPVFTRARHTSVTSKLKSGTLVVVSRTRAARSGNS